MLKKLVFLAALIGLLGGLNTLTVKAVEIDRYKTLELVFDQATSSPSNPFDTYALRLELTDPNGHSFEIDGFYDGNGSGGQTGNIWKARIAPYQTGTWSWRTVPGDIYDAGLSGLNGTFNVNTGSDHGGVVANGRYFQFQDGTPVYQVGNFLDFRSSLDRDSTHVYMSEVLSDSTRNDIMTAQRDFHTANKANIYFANKGDYSNRSVTPWVGTASSNNKSQMDLARWQNYDGYIRDFKDNEMLAEMWFFADDSNFGSMALADQQRLIRYAMARTSAFSHTSYVMALEWQEGFSWTRINDLGTYAAQHNPWERGLSVHSLSGSNWDFAGQSWPTFIATQIGNSAYADDVNSYGITIRSQDTIPHIDEEYGILYSDSDGRLRDNNWANLASGAAGGGTGSGLKAMQRFLEQSGMPFQRMAPNNGIISGGGSQNFLLSEAGHHYMVYSTASSFSVSISGTNLQARWFDPNNPNATLTAPWSVSSGVKFFSPPGAEYVLWITDGSNLNPGVTHPTGDAVLLEHYVGSAPWSLLGDANRDGVVDDKDATLMAVNWLMQSGAVWGDGDFNADGKVDEKDASILAGNWGNSASSSTSVPEPSILVMIFGVLLMGLWRRR